MDRRTSQKKQATISIISKQRKRKIQENKREQTKNAIFLVLLPRRHLGVYLGRRRVVAYSRVSVGMPSPSLLVKKAPPEARQGGAQA